MPEATANIYGDLHWTKYDIHASSRSRNYWLVETKSQAASM